MTQRAECERLARSIGVTPGQWARRVEYIDIDRSGDDSTREELGRLLRDAQPGDTVLAWKQERVGRDMIDSAAAIRELVKYRKCDLYTVETGTARIALDSAEQTAMVMLRGMAAQGELERTRSRTRDGLRQRARDGFATGPRHSSRSSTRRSSYGSLRVSTEPPMHYLLCGRGIATSAAPPSPTCSERPSALWRHLTFWSRIEVSPTYANAQRARRVRRRSTLAWPHERRNTSQNQSA